MTEQHYWFWSLVLTGGTIFVGGVVCVIYYFQLRAMRESVLQASVAAGAAEKSADALKLAERAWIMADIKFEEGMRITEGTTSTKGGALRQHTMVNARLICTNNGKTPAWITRVHIKLRIDSKVPSEPQWLQGDADYVNSIPEPIAVNDNHEFNPQYLTCEGFTTDTEFLIVYGTVKYRDVFSPERETRFGYTYVRGRGTLERIAADGDLWKYNSYT
jgi:hypothetical protein